MGQFFWHGQGGEMDKKTYSKTITKIKPGGKIKQQTYQVRTKKTQIIDRFSFQEMIFL